jgi:hypothetical protein
MSDTTVHGLHLIYTKAQVGYQHPAKGEDHCGTCKHFEVRRKNGCEIVAGKILAGDWCKKYAEKRSEESTNTAE